MENEKLSAEEVRIQYDRLKKELDYAWMKWRDTENRFDSRISELRKKCSHSNSIHLVVAKRSVSKENRLCQDCKHIYFEMKAIGSENKVDSV